MNKRSIIAMILLSIITCGIYLIFWMYLARSEFQQLSGDQSISPGLELLFCLLCAPYSLYWIYKFSSDIAKYQYQNGLQVTDNSAINLILYIFGFGFISFLLIQN